MKHLRAQTCRAFRFIDRVQTNGSSFLDYKNHELYVAANGPVCPNKQLFSSHARVRDMAAGLCVCVCVCVDINKRIQKTEHGPLSFSVPCCFQTRPGIPAKIVKSHFALELPFIKQYYTFVVIARTRCARSVCRTWDVNLFVLDKIRVGIKRL